jgi:type IV pilus assembly protein PilM
MPAGPEAGRRKAESMARSGSRLPAWGVEVTAVGLRCVRLDEAPDGGLRIIAWDVVDFSESIPDPTAVARFTQIERALRSLARRHDFTRSAVWASMRGEAAFCRTVDIPALSGSGLEAMLGYEAMQQIPYEPERVYWDHRVLSVDAEEGVRATIYAMRRDLVDDRLRKLERAGFLVDGIQIRPLALINFCAFEGLLGEGTAVVDVDYSGIQVVVQHEEEWWFRVLPMGGIDVVERIASATDRPHAEAVQLATATAEGAGTGWEELRAEVAAQLADDVAHAVRFFAAARPGLEVERVVLLHSHPTAPDLEEALGERVGAEIVVPRGFRRLQVHPDVVNAGLQEHFPALVRAAGLALQGIGEAEVDVRLFSPELIRPVGRKQSRYVYAAVALLVLLFAAGLTRSLRADRLEEGLESESGREVSGRRADEILREADLAARVGRLDAFAQGLAQPRARRLEVLDAVLERLAEESARPEGPVHLSRLRAGRGIGVRGAGPIELVLAARAWKSERESVRERLDRIAGSLVGRGGIVRCIPDARWLAERPGAPPEEGLEAGDDVVRRWLFLHRSYVLECPPEW